MTEHVPVAAPSERLHDQAVQLCFPLLALTTEAGNRRSDKLADFPGFGWDGAGIG